MTDRLMLAIDQPQHHIRSYVLRKGRLTRSQAHALQQYWHQYGVTSAMLSDPNKLFPRQGPITLEIGFGNGTALATLAVAQPHINFLGIEVYRPGIGNLLNLATRQKLTNLRIAYMDAVTAISLLMKNSLKRVLILFPDPWPKRKHQKRRLVNAVFLTSLAQCIQPDGLLYLATDCRDYAKAMDSIITDNPYFELVSPDNISDTHSISLLGISKTRFATRAYQEGNPINTLICLRTDTPI